MNCLGCFPFRLVIRFLGVGVLAVSRSALSSRINPSFSFFQKLFSGGKTLLGEERRERCQEQFRPDPGSRGRPVAAGQFVQVDEGFQPFEVELDLPATGVEFPGLVRRKLFFRKIGEEPDRFAFGVPSTDDA